MDIKNRMSDVNDLRNKVCQDFLKMVTADDWRGLLYKISDEKVQTDEQVDKYGSIYSKMSEIGVENYSVDDMDITIINEIIQYRNEILKVKLKGRTKSAMQAIANDKNNFASHLTYNEPPEELYRQGLIALGNLKNLITTVHTFERKISKDTREAFYNKYKLEVERLSSLLDEERIESVGKRKGIERDIQALLDCTDDEQRRNIWGEVIEQYSGRNFSKNMDKYFDFVVEASNRGIREAHGGAIDYYLDIKKDYVEAEKRIIRLYESYDSLPIYDAVKIANTIGTYVLRGNEMTEKMCEIIDALIKQGYPIEKTMREFHMALRGQDITGRVRVENNTKPKRIRFIIWWDSKPHLLGWCNAFVSHT